MKNLCAILHSIFVFLLKLCVITVFCLVFSFIFVYPLWLFAVTKPNAFSVSVGILCILALVTALIFKIKSRGKTEKK